MSKLKLNTKDETLRSILGNGKKYVVPKFQRDYSWESEQLENLWEDIQNMGNEETSQNMGNEETSHYMGYLVLQEVKTNEYKIIDGQQRITTFSLFILACIKRLKEINEEKIAEILFRNFIGVEEFDGIRINKKLELNKNNHYYYNQAVEGNELPKRGKKKTVHLMRQALDYWYDNIKDDQGQDIGTLVKKISDQLLFTVMYIGDELNAYKVFETLNARGVQLSSADLLKNHIFSLIDVKNDIPDEVLNELEDKWEKIGSNIGDKYYTDYILCEWNSRHKIVRKANLFTSIKKEINNNKLANSYLNDISIKSDLYDGIINPDSEYFREDAYYKEIKKSLEFLKLFGIKQPFSLLMIAYQKHKEKFHTILEWIKIFSLRYNVICQEHTGDQERLYNDICLLINNNGTLEDIKEKILTRYPKDDTFKLAFADKTMLTRQNNKKAKYLLARLEETPSNPIDESTLTIEHILPQNPTEEWINAFGNNYDLFTQRIGNMALVSTTLNKELSQKSFTQKQDLLKNNSYTINKNIADHEQWTSSDVESRQNKLADMAIELWKIN